MKASFSAARGHTGTLEGTERLLEGRETVNHLLKLLPSVFWVVGLWPLSNWTLISFEARKTHTGVLTSNYFIPTDMHRCQNLECGPSFSTLNLGMCVCVFPFKQNTNCPVNPKWCLCYLLWLFQFPIWKPLMFLRTLVLSLSCWLNHLACSKHHRCARPMHGEFDVIGMGWLLGIGRF